MKAFKTVSTTNMRPLSLPGLKLRMWRLGDVSIGTLVQQDVMDNDWFSQPCCIICGLNTNLLV